MVMFGLKTNKPSLFEIVEKGNGITIFPKVRIRGCRRYAVAERQKRYITRPLKVDKKGNGGLVLCKPTKSHGETAAHRKDADGSMRSLFVKPLDENPNIVLVLKSSIIFGSPAFSTTCGIKEHEAIALLIGLCTRKRVALLEKCGRTQGMVWTEEQNGGASRFFWGIH